jgi:hypothetical protein
VFELHRVYDESALCDALHFWRHMPKHVAEDVYLHFLHMPEHDTFDLICPDSEPRHYTVKKKTKYEIDHGSDVQQTCDVQNHVYYVQRPWRRATPENDRRHKQCQNKSKHWVDDAVVL